MAASSSTPTPAATAIRCRALSLCLLCQLLRMPRLPAARTALPLCSATTPSHAVPVLLGHQEVTDGGLLWLQTKVKVYISYGGLLMLLTGDLHKLKDLEVDSTVYLLIRKV